MSQRSQSKQPSSTNASKSKQIKLVLLGESGVGKSSIALRYARGEFNENGEATIGGQLYCYTSEYIKILRVLLSDPYPTVLLSNYHYRWIITQYEIFSLSLYQYRYEGPSWSWSYGSWIHNYLCNQCLSPLKLWVRTPFMARCTRYNILW